ncbi:MAG: PKD domain-containing protein [bacterium]|nr:PKD domain-containing protein [bacterium]
MRHVPSTGESIIRIPAGKTAEQVADSLMATGLFQYAEPDWILYPAGPPELQTRPASRPEPVSMPVQGVPNCPNDPLYSTQWHHQPNIMDSCNGWSATTGSSSISVAVCDTGIRTTHEEFQLHRLEGYNAVDMLWESEGGNITPAHRHGTRTTGAVAANGNNGLGGSGVGWNLSHRMVRVSNASDGGAQLSDITHGARTAAENGDRVVNVSYHGVTLNANKTTASYIKSLGGLYIWIAGNTSANLGGDRDSDDLIVVGGTDPNDDLVWSSAYGNFVDLVAPGTGIVTSDSSSDSAYVTVEGTSYAGPLAAGVCAMIWSQRPNLSPNDVERILKASAEDIGSPGVDEFFGYGRVNLAQALLSSWDEAPVADFASPATTGRSPLPVTFTDLSTGVPTSWDWDFGDGGTSTLQNPTHIYQASGTYTVSLTVGNAYGSDTVTKTDFVLVDVIPPVADFAASVTAGLAPLDVDFTDQSTGGVPSSWLWDFGDGATSTLQNPSHTYTASGFHAVSLTVTNPYGSDTLTRTGYVTVDFIPPVASFSGTPVSAASPFVTTFTDESTGGVATAWSWSFGDGYGSTTQNPTHTYTVPGTYSVRLTASNAYGSDILWRTDYIEVGPGPPILADFVGAPTTGAAPLQVDFTDQSVGHIISWEWDFGDDVQSTLQHPSHIFTIPDEEYDIALTVTNADGTDSNLELRGYITTTEASSSVPPVPDGAWVPGAQLLAGRNLVDPNLADVTWDATSCPAVDYNLYHGELGAFDVVVGGVCDLGATGAATVTIPGNATWWVIVGQDGADSVGSQGRDSSGAERTLVDWDQTCEQTQLDLTGTCP